MKTEWLKETFGLEGRRILIVGGFGNIGSGVVNALGNAGAEVLVTSRSQSSIDAGTKELRDAGVNCLGGFVLNIVDKHSFEKAAQDFLKLCPDGRLDGLVLNAGGNVKDAVIGPEESFFGSSSDAAYDAINLNYLGARETCRVFGKFLLKGKSSVITVMGSVAHLGLSRVLDYGAGKAGLDRLVQFLAIHLCKGQENPIRVNGVRVGFIFSDDADSQNSFARQDPQRFNAIMEHIPMGRSATPEEIGDMVVVCQSKAASYVNGAMLDVDGGFLCNRLGPL